MSGGRECHDWLSEFMTFCAWGEAPQRMYFWTGVATVAAAMRRRTWLDMGSFQWIPNLYTLIVAPPGIVSKSTTADQGFDLLQKVPGIHFGPTTATWQALLDAFGEVHEGFDYQGEMMEMSALAISSSEFGNFLNPQNTEMIDQLVHIWDGKYIRKRTRMDGEKIIMNPCLNLIACTTPDWIAQNVPRYLVGGGLTSRMLFIYADEKEKYVAYPDEVIPPDHKERKARLIRDLERISLLLGPFTLTPAAKVWGKDWYEHFHKVEAKNLDATLIGGYIARKQTLSHKIAMCLSASKGDSLVIEREDLERAIKLITELEPFMPMVYSRIGMSAEAEAGQRVIAFLKRAGGESPFVVLYKYMHKDFPDPGEFNKLLLGLKDSGQLTLVPDTKVRLMIRATK